MVVDLMVVDIKFDRIQLTRKLLWYYWGKTSDDGCGDVSIGV